MVFRTNFLRMSSTFLLWITVEKYEVTVDSQRIIYLLEYSSKYAVVEFLSSSRDYRNVELKFSRDPPMHDQWISVRS